MRPFARSVLFYLLFLGSLAVIPRLQAAQSNSGSLNGTVSDPSGAVIPGASVSILNPVSKYTRTATTDDLGQFHFANVPFNHYHLTASRDGFAAYATDVNVQSAVAVTTNIHLQIGAASNTITVEGGEDLIESDPTAHTDIDRELFDRFRWKAPPPARVRWSRLLHLESPPTPTACFTALGDHASNSFSIDGQPITDQQSKVFSNQIPPTPSSRWRSSPVRRRPSTATRPAWSSR